MDAQKDGSSRNDVKWRGLPFWRRTGFLSLTTAAVLKSYSSQVNCQIDGRGRLLPDLCYPNVCWDALIFAVQFTLPQHIALLI